MLSQNYNQVDETTTTVLAKNKKNASHRGYMWVLYNPKQQSALFNYHPNRSIGTAKQHNWNVQNYLTWLFKKIACEKMTDANIKSCLPYNLSPEQTGNIDSIEIGVISPL